MDGSAPDAAPVGEAAISLGLRHAAMPLETSRRAVASEIRHAGLCRYAERLDLSNHLSADLSGDGPAAPLHPPVDFDRSLTAAFRLYVHEPAAGAFLLRAVSGGRLERRLF